MRALLVPFLKSRKAHPVPLATSPLMHRHLDPPHVFLVIQGRISTLQAHPFATTAPLALRILEILQVALYAALEQVHQQLGQRHVQRALLESM